jgi:uncharacterized membrane protein YfcA
MVPPVELHLAVVAALAFVTSAAGALGGLGGAVILVPVLVLLGVDPAEAAPLGLLSVAAGSLAAAPVNLVEGVVHHRLGVTIEVAASAGAVAGAALASSLPASVGARVLAATALAASVAGALRRGVRNPPQPAFAAERSGEWPGTLAGAYVLGEGVVPYAARRVGAGLAAMAFTGVVSGATGVSGGFLKTPAMTEIMGIPVKVAAATTVFTVGITSGAALIVYAGDGRVDVHAGAAVVLAALAGGRIGAWLQSVLAPAIVRRVLSAVLFVVAITLAVTG